MPLETIAKKVGTPAYVYSYATLSRHYQVFDAPFKETPHLICYSMKSNSNAAILKIFLNLGSGIDIVSGGELYRALDAGADPKKIVYSGVSKTAKEIAEALKAGILMFNVESRQELHTINKVAQELDLKAPISIRVNPDIDPKTHPYISTGLKTSKFGIDIEEVEAVFAQAAQLEHIEVIGVDCHIGSQITEMSPFLAALAKMEDLIQVLRQKYSLPIQYLDLGGGLGIPYKGETPPHPREYAEAIQGAARDLGCTLVFEPGRVLVGNAGILLTEVIYTKNNQNKHYVIADSGMNHLIRPMLYDAYHLIQPVHKDASRGEQVVDIVGPICESSDFFAQGRNLQKMQSGDLLAIMSAGAYGYTMASTYNSYPRPAEVLVKGDEFAVIRERDTYEDVCRGEKLPEFEL